MARGASKGIWRNKIVRRAVEGMEGNPFTASDLIDWMMNEKVKNKPAIREVGMVLRVMVKEGTLTNLGQEGSLLGRQLLEQAGLTQSGVRKVTLYIESKYMDEEE
jgi:hypothetical protein